MVVKLIKKGESKWLALSCDKKIGEVKPSYKYGGTYEATLDNGKTIYAVNQESLKRMIQEEINENTPVKSITIPKRDKEGYFVELREITVQWTCPECGVIMGEPELTQFHEDGHTFSVHTWSNKCSHIVKYTDLKVIDDETSI